MLLLANLLIAFMADAYETIKSEAESRWCYQLFHLIQDRKLQRNLRKKIGKGVWPCTHCCYKGDIAHALPSSLTIKNLSGNHSNRRRSVASFSSMKSGMKYF